MAAEMTDAFLLSVAWCVILSGAFVVLHLEAM